VIAQLINLFAPIQTLAALARIPQLSAVLISQGPSQSAQPPGNVWNAIIKMIVIKVLLRNFAQQVRLVLNASIGVIVLRLLPSLVVKEELVWLALMPLSVPVSQTLLISVLQVVQIPENALNVLIEINALAQLMNAQV